MADRGEGLIEVPGGWAEITYTGLRIFDKTPKKKAWVETWDMMIAARQMSAWALGDLYNVGEGMGEEIHQHIKAYGVSLKTVRNHASVCKGYLYRERMFPPSFTHHEIVIKLPKPRRNYWLKRSVAEDLDSETLAELTAKERGVEKKEKVAGVDKVKAGVLIALEGCVEMGIEADRLGYRSPLEWIRDDIGEGD